MTDGLPISALKSTLLAGPPLRLAMLFGSFAAGQPHSESDVDIAILPLDPQLALSDELRLQAALERVLARDVDLVRLDHASTLVRYQVARDGLCLLEASPFERSRFIASAVADYLDFEPALSRAARLFRRRVAERRLREDGVDSPGGEA